MATTIKEIIEDIHLPKVRVGTIPYVEIGDINIATKKVLLKQKSTVAGAKLCPEDSVIISRVRPNRGAVGLIEKEVPVSSAFTVLKTKKEICHPKYLFYYLAWNNNFFSFLQSRATGATYPTVKEEEILNYPVRSLPNLAEQRRIIAILEEAESLKKKRAEADQKMNELIPALFVRMFGDPTKNSNGWEFSPLKNYIKVKHGFAFKGEFFSENGRYVLLTPGNFYESGGYKDRGAKQKYYTGEIPESYILTKDDLLLAMTEQAPGLLASPLLVPESNRFLHNQRLGLVIYNESKFNRYFLFHLFNHSSVRRLVCMSAIGTKVQHTSPSKIEWISTVTPPIELQNQFAEKVKQIEAQKEKQKQSSIHLEVLFSSLLDRSFSKASDFSKP